MDVERVVPLDVEDEEDRDGVASLPVPVDRSLNFVGSKRRSSILTLGNWDEGVGRNPPSTSSSM
jgi:hypothetical protein